MSSSGVNLDDIKEQLHKYADKARNKFEEIKTDLENSDISVDSVKEQLHNYADKARTGLENVKNAAVEKAKETVQKAYIEGYKSTQKEK